MSQSYLNLDASPTIFAIYGRRNCICRSPTLIWMLLLQYQALKRKFEEWSQSYLNLDASPTFSSRVFVRFFCRSPTLIWMLLLPDTVIAATESSVVAVLP